MARWEARMIRRKVAIVSDDPLSLEDDTVIIR
jgi:hypothetical protein